MAHQQPPNTQTPPEERLSRFESTTAQLESVVRDTKSLVADHRWNSGLPSYRIWKQMQPIEERRKAVLRDGLRLVPPKEPKKWVAPPKEEPLPFQEPRGPGFEEMGRMDCDAQMRGEDGELKY